MRFPAAEDDLQRECYRYEFDPSVSIKDIEETLFLALTSAGGIHGDAEVRLEGGFRLCEDHGTVALDATSSVGRDLARIFTQLATAQFGEESFTVERLPSGPEAPPAATLAGMSR